MPSAFMRSGFGVGRRFLSVGACCTLAALVVGCGDGRPPVYPVHGEVRVNGRAPAHALVGFHPVGDAAPDAVYPVGEVDDQGRFTLTSYKTGDGAPEGEYRVTVAWFLASGRPGDDSPPANYLPAAYARRDATPLRAVVGKGGVQLPPFELQAK